MSQAAAVRSHSGFFCPSPRERIERVIRDLVEHSIAAYRSAAEARAAGDEPGADALRDAGERAWTLATNALDEIASQGI